VLHFLRLVEASHCVDCVGTAGNICCTVLPARGGRSGVFVTSGSYTADKYVCSTEKKVANGVIVTKCWMIGE